MPLVGVVIGSKSDEPVIQDTIRALESLGIEYEVNAMSAHRAPRRVMEYAKTARERGIEVIIAGAGDRRRCRGSSRRGRRCQSSACPWRAAS